MIINLSPTPIGKRFRGALQRYLLQRDRSYPERTDEEFEEEVERNYRWNFVFNTFDVSAFFFGASLISGWTIVPLFISKLTTSPIPIGIAALLAQGSWYLPQLLTANFIERSPAMKPIVVNLGFFLERVPLWVIVGSAMLATQSPILALVLFLAAYAWHGLGAGMLGPAWQDMIARCFPVEKRGRFLGFSSSLGTLTGVAGSALSIWLLSTYTFPDNFTLLFLLAAGAILLSWVFLTFVREPIPVIHTFRQTRSEFISSLSNILRSKRNFRRFIIARLLLVLGSMGAGFITLSAIQIWGVSDSMVGTFTTMQLVGQGIGTFLLGLLADRKGHKISLEISAIASGLGFFLAWIAPTQYFYLAVFLLLGFASGGAIVSGILVVMEFAEPERRPTYIGINGTAVGIMGMIAPMLGTGLAAFSFPWLFGLSAFISVLGAGAMRFWVQEPRFTTST
jgi:MFS family permease